MRFIASRRFVGAGSATRPPALRLGVVFPSSRLLGVYERVRAPATLISSTSGVASVTDAADLRRKGDCTP